MNLFAQGQLSCQLNPDYLVNMTKILKYIYEQRFLRRISEIIKVVALGKMVA